MVETVVMVAMVVMVEKVLLAYSQVS